MKKTRQPDYYTSSEVMCFIKSNEELIYVESGVEGALIRIKDIPDFIVDINRRFGTTDNEYYEPIITTKGEFLDKVTPDMRKK